MDLALVSEQSQHVDSLAPQGPLSTGGGPGGTTDPRAL